MDELVEGDGGGIRGLRLLIEGENAGAINTDLRTSGLPGLDWAGTTQLSWWELQEFIKWIPIDGKSAISRQMNPDSEWTLETRLLAAIASHTSGIRHMTAAPILGETMPDDWAASIYGPEAKSVAEAKKRTTSPRGKTVEEQKAIAARARQAAAGVG